MEVKAGSIIEMKSGNITALVSISRALRMVCRLDAYQDQKLRKEKKRHFPTVYCETSLY